MTIELNSGRNVYVCSKITGYDFRQALSLKERQEREVMDTILLDDIANFICELYGNKFSISDLYKGLKTNEILSVFNNVIRLVIQSTIKYQKH